MLLLQCEIFIFRHMKMSEEKHYYDNYYYDTNSPSKISDPESQSPSIFDPIQDCHGDTSNISEPSSQLGTTNVITIAKPTQDDTKTQLPSPVLDLAGLMEKKAELSKTLADLEREIYATEGDRDFIVLW